VQVVDGKEFEELIFGTIKFHHKLLVDSLPFVDHAFECLPLWFFTLIPSTWAIEPVHFANCSVLYLDNDFLQPTCLSESLDIQDAHIKNIMFAQRIAWLWNGNQQQPNIGWKVVGVNGSWRLKGR
jgi:hypothetical protein